MKIAILCLLSIVFFQSLASKTLESTVTDKKKKKTQISEPTKKTSEKVYENATKRKQNKNKT